MAGFLHIRVVTIGGMGSQVHKLEMPGIGTRYDMAGNRAPQRVSVIVHKDGRREIYSFEEASADPTSVIELTADQARLLGAILSGTYVSD